MLGPTRWPLSRGLRADRRHGGAVRNYFEPNPAGQYNGLTGGNPDLKAETALTTSFGIGWTPSFIPGFRAQIDYYNIKIEGVIQGLGGANILQQCLQNDALCGDIHRDQFGSLWILNSGARRRLRR